MRSRLSIPGLPKKTTAHIEPTVVLCGCARVWCDGRGAPPGGKVHFEGAGLSLTFINSKG